MDEMAYISSHFMIKWFEFKYITSLKRGTGVGWPEIRGECSTDKDEAN